MTQHKSLFLAQGQIHLADFNQENLDAWNRARGYGDSGTPKYDDFEKAERADKTLFKMDSEGHFMYVSYNRVKYVFKPELEAVA